MFVVEALGKRYLWVQFLCMVEGDELEMKVMIHAMDSIYKTVALTVIAASGRDAEARIVALYPGSRLIQYATGFSEGLRLVSTERNLRLELKFDIRPTLCSWPTDLAHGLSHFFRLHAK
jgi:hypothetical protein